MQRDSIETLRKQRKIYKLKDSPSTSTKGFLGGTSQDYSPGQMSNLDLETQQYPKVNDHQDDAYEDDSNRRQFKNEGEEIHPSQDDS